MTVITAKAKVSTGLAVALSRLIKAVDKDADVVLDPPFPSPEASPVAPLVDGEPGPV